MHKKSSVIAGSLSAILSCAVMAHEEGFHQHGAHVHGQVQMSMASADNELLIDWHTPAGDIFGFEHTPESSQQLAVIKNELAWLESAAWIEFPYPDTCQLEHAQAHTDLLNDSHSGHADVEVTMHWQCDRNIELGSIKIKLFQRYDNLQSIHYDWLDENQSGSGVLNASQQKIQL